MGGEEQRHVVDRIGEMIEGLGGTRSGAESRQSDGAPADRSDDVEPVTDGGADEASPGDSTWSADDPIAFDDESDAERGSAILDAVTDDDDSTSPFDDAVDDALHVTDGDDPVSDDSTPNDPTSDDPVEDGSGSENDERSLDAGRLDELEARIGALETDHVQLDSQLAEVATAVEDLRGDVGHVGNDVRELVTVLGGIALATQRSGEANLDVSELATTIADELETVETSSATGRTERDLEDDPADDHDEMGAATTSDDPDSSSDEPSTDTATFPPDAAPEGIHRGIGDTSDTATASSQEPLATEAVDPESGDPRTTDPQTADPQAESTEALTGDSSNERSRELVDPRSDAVGARLRQFREGFVDDPTEDLPTGNTADEFRFEKVLLPSDGEAAPDLSAEELEKPYLESLPDGYAADAVVLEWLDWLVSAADGETAAHAIAYYESILWLTEDARAELLGYLEGLGGPTDVDVAARAGEPPAALDLQDHLRSLQYVTELATGEVGTDGI